jgi:2-polyprenyl-6-methoxyphenol hydroxylase-like FAD-dependent oxidoreductase
MKAIIIGAGIAGPVTALALRKAGIESAVFEEYEQSADGVGGMLSLAPNGLNALQIIDAADAVRRIGQPIPDFVIGDASGRRYGRFNGLPGLPPSLVMWRCQLYRALQDHAIAQGVRIQCGKRLLDVAETRSEIAARFADGTTECADLLIGADGIRSTVRGLIDPNAPGPRYTGLLGFGGHANGAALQVDSGAMHFVFGKKAFLGYWADTQGGITWFCNLPHAEPMTIAEARTVPRADWWQVLWEANSVDVPGRELIEHTNPHELLVMGGGEILPSIPRWHRGRMVLVGDSAHAPSSSSGQGASLAVESAIELARCLRDLPDAASAFTAYERVRRPRVEEVAARAARTNSNKAAGPLAKALMGLVMPIALRTFLRPERTIGALHRYRIDWNQIATA